MFKAVHSQIAIGRLLNWNVGRLRTAQDFIDIVERAMIHVKHAPVDLAKDRNGVACMSTKHEGGLILGYYNIERMLKRVVTSKGMVLLCGTCMDARGMSDAELMDGVRRGTIDELANAIADKVLVF